MLKDAFYRVTRRGLAVLVQICVRLRLLFALLAVGGSIWFVVELGRIGAAESGPLAALMLVLWSLLATGVAAVASLAATDEALGDSLAGRLKRRLLRLIRALLVVMAFGLALSLFWMSWRALRIWLTD